MATTNNLAITKLEQSQAQKDVTVNEALIKIDALINTAIIDKDLATPPGSPREGDLYIVAAGATGDWSGEEGKLAHYNNSSWNFITPNEGALFWIADEDQLYVYDGSFWANYLDQPQNISLLGVKATADSTNRLAVSSPAILFDAEIDDIQVKLNKEAVNDTASFLFQTNFSGRAEIGLTGDDDFHVKVSPNGSTWHEAVVIDKNSAGIHIKQGLSFDGGTNVLKEYEEGTFTPYFSFVDYVTYTRQVGRYKRIGNIAYLEIEFSWSNIDTGDGSWICVRGLPFQAAEEYQFTGIVNKLVSDGFNWNQNELIQPTQHIVNVTALHFLGYTGAAQHRLSYNRLNTTGSLYCSGYYFI